jgi:preprotein translocase subunit SecB
MDATKQPGLQIAHIILLRAHFAHRDDAFALPPNTPIQDLPLRIEAKVGGKTGEPAAVVSLRVFTEKNPELLYSFDVEIAALVTRVPGEENLDPFEYVNNMGPAAFFPFLREALANLTMRGRFGPIWLKPMNFVALSQQAADADVATVSEG